MYISSGETKVLFALVDAAADLGLLQQVPAGAKWPAVREKILGTDPEKEGPFLWGLLVDLENARVLTGSWIEDRWRMIKKQVAQSREMTHNPFFPSAE